VSCSGGSLLLVCVGLLGKKQVRRRERPLRTIICGIGRRAAAREVARRLNSDVEVMEASHTISSWSISNKAILLLDRIIRTVVAMAVCRGEQYLS